MCIFSILSVGEKKSIMEFTQELIDALNVNEVEIMQRIAQELSVRVAQVGAVITLVNEGCTIPFISRYRKEMHGSLDEVQVRDCDHLFKSYSNLENRRLEIIRGIFAQGKLNESLFKAVNGAATLTELEDLWLPFKKKKKTRGMAAVEKGLEPLADLMLELDDVSIEKKAAEYVHEDAENPELTVASAEDALAGAKDILAERVSQDSENRSEVRAFYLKTGMIRVKGVGTEAQEKTSVYQMYWDYAEALNQIKSHRILAVNRGEREGVLEVEIDVDMEGAVALLQRKCALNNKYHKDAVEDGLVRLLSPAVVREIRSDQSDMADEHGIGIFSENLKNLLMQQPIKGTRVLGVDPGIRTGTKCAALDETGKYLGYFVINQQTQPALAEAAIKKAIKEYDVQLVAVGNGTGSKDVQQVVSNVISAHYPDVRYTVVDEDGASVYSASDTAREEFPELDLTIRGAISIGRRLQDPLAELVKIDPKSIGVGLYQHDVNQKKLSEMLDEVVSSVVNQVGVNLNTASFSLLKYVSGINSALAKKIVSYRNENGIIKSRSDLKKVGGMGEKIFEQCAGFLKILESADPLDKTWVHPENYDAAREVLPLIKSDVPAALKKQLMEKYAVGEQTLSDIIEELKKPNRDPRESYPKPIMQTGVVTFEDLKEGMRVTGKIKNVVDFGAFVDLGLKETALLHISEMSDSYISDPMAAVKVGDVNEYTILSLDKDRKRISLSLKSDASTRLGGSASGAALRAGASTDTNRTNRIAPNGTNQTNRVAPNGSRPQTGKTERGNGERERSSQYAHSNDGMTYNPFAALLKNK
ncbi:MAG: Tex family protein [Treponemataceae bacterium]|nr:MAG: Tex family protein [Treponemataceae bacterium]